MIIGQNPKVRDSVKNDANMTIDKGLIAHFQVSAANAVAGNNASILLATALTASTQSITSGITNPGVPRSIRIVGNVAGIIGDVTIKGTNYKGELIIETLTLNGITVVEGAKAFKTVTEIDLPIQTAVGNTVSVGFGEKLGLPYKLVHNTVLFAFLDNIREATAATVTTSSTLLELNTIDLNSALAGKVVDAYIVI